MEDLAARVVAQAVPQETAVVQAVPQEATVVQAEICQAAATQRLAAAHPGALCLVVMPQEIKPRAPPAVHQASKHQAAGRVQTEVPQAVIRALAMLLAVIYRSQA